MKKKPSDYHTGESIQDKRILRDDVEFALEHLCREGFAVTISDDDYQYENLDEVINRTGGRPEKLTIDATDQIDDFNRESLTITIDQRWVFVHIHGLGRIRSSALELAKRFREAPDRVFRLARPGRLYWPALVALNVELWWLIQDNNSTPLQHALVLSPIILWLVSLPYSYLVPGFELKRRHENFLARNRDNLLLLLIGSILGGAATYLFGLLS